MSLFRATALVAGVCTSAACLLAHPLGYLSAEGPVDATASPTLCPSPGWCALSAKLSSICPPPGVDELCQEVASGSGGAAPDPVRGRLVLWNAGEFMKTNEVYGLDLRRSAFERLTTPSLFDASCSPLVLSDGAPLARLIYDGATYVP